MSDIGQGTPVGGQRGETKTDIKGLLKNKKFQIAAGAVALIGVVVLVMRRNGSVNPGDATAAAGAAGTKGYIPGGYQGGADTTGTDIASFLSNWGAQQNSAFSEWMQQIQNATPAAGSGVGTTSLAAPTGLKDNSPLNWTDSIQIGWTPVSGASSYEIRNYADPSGAITNVGNVDAYQIRNLVHNGSYFWQIRSKDAQGNASDWSDYVTTHTKN